MAGPVQHWQAHLYRAGLRGAPRPVGSPSAVNRPTSTLTRRRALQELTAGASEDGLLGEPESRRLHRGTGSEAGLQSALAPDWSRVPGGQCERSHRPSPVPHGALSSAHPAAARGSAARP